MEQGWLTPPEKNHGSRFPQPNLASGCRGQTRGHAIRRDPVPSLASHVPSTSRNRTSHPHFDDLHLLASMTCSVLVAGRDSAWAQDHSLMTRALVDEPQIFVLRDGSGTGRDGCSSKNHEVHGRSLEICRVKLVVWLVVWLVGWLVFLCERMAFKSHQ